MRPPADPITEARAWLAEHDQTRAQLARRLVGDHEAVTHADRAGAAPKQLDTLRRASPGRRSPRERPAAVRAGRLAGGGAAFFWWAMSYPGDREESKRLPRSLGLRVR